MATLLAFHGDPAVKTKYLDRVRAHRKADLLAKGATGHPEEGQKGCAVACTMNRYDHARYPVEIGVPEHLAHLEDAIFEGLTVEESQEWPTDFLSAINTGADLSMAWPRFALALLSDPESPIVKTATEPDVKAAVEGVAALYREWVESGTKPLRARWEEARRAAYAGAAWAAWAAGDAAWAAGNTAWAADAAYAGAAAWRWMRDTLLRILRETK